MRDPLDFITGPRTPRYSIVAHKPFGGIAIITHHATEGSRDVEIAAFKSRMARGELAFIEVTNHIEPFGSYKIYPERV